VAERQGRPGVTSRTTDVLVIGGGPAGATAAFQLASAGIPVTVIDRAIFPRDKPCGESLSPGAIRRLQDIAMWPAPPNVTAPGHPVKGMRIRSPRGTAFFGRYKTVGPPGHVIRRVAFDAQLLDCARARGARVVEGVEALAAQTSADGATVDCRSVDGGQRLRMTARRVVVADGRRSFIGRALGFIETTKASRQSARFAVRVHFDHVSGLSEFAEMHVGEGGYCGIAPLSGTSANICYVLFTDRLDMTPATIEPDVRRHLSAYPEIAARLRAARVCGPIRIVGPLRIRSQRQAVGPFIACGDTTGFLDPFTGEGIAHAIASAGLGAEAVRASLHGRSDAFSAYERRIRDLRRVKSGAALLLYGLVSRRALANAAASVFAALPGLGDAAVRLFGDQV
jgi:flavin-dependent dehydrogenase